MTAYRRPTTGSTGSHRKLAVLLFASSGAMGFTASTFGPSLPLMMDELQISRTVAGLHYSAWALGAVSTSLFLNQLSNSRGRRAVFWAAAWCLAIGAAIVALGSSPWVTIAGAFVAGSGGMAVIATARSSLADLDRDAIARSLTINDTSWSIGSLLPGLLIAAFVGLGIGWRPVFAIPLIAVTLIFLKGSQYGFPDDGRVRSSNGSNFSPAMLWLTLAAFLPAIAGEWSTIAWVASFMIERHDSSIQVGALTVTIFAFSILVGRVIGTQVSKRFSAKALFNGGLGVAFGGSTVISISPTPQMAWLGLVICGLGVSLLAPMIVTIAIGLVPDEAQKATSLFSLSAGTAILLAPLALGWLADRADDIASVFWVIPTLFGLCWVLQIPLHVAQRRAVLQKT